MEERIKRILNIIMSSSIGVFFGYSIYEYWHFKNYPNLYTMQSAPWYIHILVYGLFTVALLTICTIIKVLFMKKIKPMKKIALMLGIVFLSLTFVGSSYVLINHGHVNAGYAVIPMLWTILCFGYYRNSKYK